MYRLKINGKSYVEVQGTESWTKTIVRDFNDRIFRTKGEFEFKGWGDLFDLLYEHIRAKGVCNSLNGRVYLQDNKLADFQEWWRGEIKMQDIEFDLIKDSADAQVLDDVWAAKFANSDKQKVFLQSTESKKSNFIPSCQFELCDFFLPETGVYGYAGRQCFSVFDAFTFLVNYHTDGAVTFASDYFETGDGMKYYITTGKEIRTGSNDANPEISFEDLFDEMNKKFCLFIIIETDDFDNPVLRIEPQIYVFDNQRALTINDPENIKMQVDLKQLYTIIKVGSDAKDYNGTDAKYPNVRFEAWNEEEYNTPGDCEFENQTLDLVSSWQIDSNSIEHQLLSDPDPGDYEDDIFIVEIDTYLDAYQYESDFTTADTVQFYYNANLTNDEVIDNWFEGIPQQIIKAVGKDYYVYVDDTDRTFHNGGSTQIDNILYQNDSTLPASDVDDIYTVAAEDAGDDNIGEFKIPASGIYTVHGEQYVTATGNFSLGQLTFQILMQVYEDNTRATLLRSVAFQGTWGVFLSAAGTARCLTEINGVDYNSFFFDQDNCVVFSIRKQEIGSVGGRRWRHESGFMSLDLRINPLYNTANPQPLIYQYDINKFKLTVDQFNTLDNNLGYIRFIDTKKNLSYDVWATELKYNPLRQIVEVGKFLGRPPILECEWLLLNGQWDDDGCWDDNNIWIDPESAWFIMTVKTDNAGVSANDEFQIPTTGAGYDYIVDWGDGSLDTGITGTETHTYSAPGTYTVKVTGAFPRIYFNNGGDRLKLLTIEQWGDIAWTALDDAFYGCANMTGTFTDSPILQGSINLSRCFRACTVFNTSIDGWDISSVNSIAGMFRDAVAFNQSLNSWNTSNVTSITSTFYGASAFNQPLDNWDTSNMTGFVAAFRDAIAFDQDIGAWDISNVGAASNMFNGVTLSTANYDALLTGWTGWSGGAATRSVPAGISFHAGGSTYSLGTDAEDARTYLDVTQTWTITDGGGV